jgi:rubrerythrin
MVYQDKKVPPIVERLASNEESIAKLYQGYAEAFPVLLDFWTSLAVEEMNHASWLKDLGAKTLTSKTFVDESRFNTYALQTLTNYLDKETTRLNEQKTPLTEALSIACFIEQSLIETNYFEVFRADSAEIKRVFNKLRDETLAHGKKAKAELEKHRKTQPY